MKRWLPPVLLALAPLLAGCGSSTVTLRHPETGVIVRCSAATGEEGQARCIDNFKSQGFEPAS